MSSEEISISIGTEPSTFPTKEKLKIPDTSNEVVNRRRSNSQSQVVSMPSHTLRTVPPPKRKKFHYVVTMTSLNDTFVKKTLTVPYFPDIRRLGRPAGVKIKPDSYNGYFDSRVLSRNHAAMYIDPENGKLMLKDMGSSNGTYVNEQKIGTEAVKIEIGDIIYLGFNIQVDTNHKQISAKIENINVSSNTPNISERPVKDKTSPEYMYHEFLQGISDYVNKENTSQMRLHCMDEALFGDLNPDFGDYEIETSRSTSGMFKNSHIVRSLPMENVISRLTGSLEKIESQNHILNSIESFVQSYRVKLDELNSNYLKSAMMATKEKYEMKLKEETKRIEEERKNFLATKEILDSFTAKSNSEIEILKKKLSLLEEEKLSLSKSLEELKQLKSDDQHFNGNDRKSNDKILINNTASDNIQSKKFEGNNLDLDLNNPSPSHHSNSDRKGSIDRFSCNSSSRIESDNIKKDVPLRAMSAVTTNSTTITPPMSDTEEIKKMEEYDELTLEENGATIHLPKSSKFEPGNNLQNSKAIDFKRNGVYVSLIFVLLGLVFDRLSK